MKVIEIKIRVVADDGVKPEDLANVVKNQCYFLVGCYELQGGHVDWRRAMVRAE